MKKLLGCLALCGLVTLPVVGGEADKTKPLQGDWQVVGMKFQGKDAPKAFVEKLNINANYTADAYTVKKGGETEEKGKYKVDTSKKPHAIDFMIQEGKDKGKTQLGVYKIEGDTFILSVGEPGTDRPTSVESKAGEKYFVIVMKKAKGTK